MRVPGFVIPFVLGCTLLSCSSSKKLADEQPAAEFKTAAVKSIVIDGNDADWQGLPTATSPASTFTYSIARNEKTLYVLVKMDNPVEQTKFLRSGMEVWIDPTNKKCKSTEVVFPVKGELNEADLRPENATADQKVNRGMMHLHVKAALVSMDRNGFKPAYNGVQTLSQTTGFKAAFNWTSENTLVYELEIPLQAFQTPLPQGAFDLGFSIGAIERANDNAAVVRRGTGGGWNGGGMRRGGMRGGGGRYEGGGYARGGQARSAGNGRATENTDWKKMTGKENFWVQCKS